MSKPEKEMILIHETVVLSWIRDASTLALFVALIGIGVYLESTVMQWVGAIIGFIAIFSRAGSTVKRMSEAEALEFLRARAQGQETKEE